MVSYAYSNVNYYDFSLHMSTKTLNRLRLVWVVFLSPLRHLEGIHILSVLVESILVLNNRLYVTNGDLKLFATISVFCERHSGEIEFCSDKQLVIFIKKSLPRFVKYSFY